MSNYNDNWADLDDLDSAVVKTDTRERHTCDKCRGTGAFVTGGHYPRPAGKCFACSGKGYFLTSRAVRSQGRANAAAAKARKVEGNMAAFIESLPGGAEEMGEIAGFLAQGAAWSEFYASLLAQLQTRGSLSDAQLAAVRRGMSKADEKRAPSGALDAAPLAAAFAKAVASGLKRPRLIAGPVVFSLAPATGRNAGHYYASHEGAYAGKISPAGEFTPSRDASGEVVAAVKSAAADPLAAALAHGRETGECSCCGRMLTDPASIAKGIGPICEAKWF